MFYINLTVTTDFFYYSDEKAWHMYEGMGQGEEILQRTCFVFDDDGTVEMVLV